MKRANMRRPLTFEPPAVITPIDEGEGGVDWRSCIVRHDCPKRPPGRLELYIFQGYQKTRTVNGRKVKCSWTYVQRIKCYYCGRLVPASLFRQAWRRVRHVEPSP